jgi:putative DNA primase/helicase
MKPERRRDEAQFWSEFEEVRPRILGALLDAAASGLKNLPNVKLDEPPRMADFATWVNACEESLGVKPGEALATYDSNRTETHNLALESSPLYKPVVELAQEGFSGTVTELQTRLNSIVSEGVRRSIRWPKAPSALGSALRRMASNLRAVGIEIHFSRADIQGRRVVSIVPASEPRKRVSVAVSDRN